MNIFKEWMQLYSPAQTSMICSKIKIIFMSRNNMKQYTELS